VSKKQKAKPKSQSPKISFWSPASLISTFFGIGRVPFAPGTFGSIAGLAVFIFFHIWWSFVDFYFRSDIWQVYLAGFMFCSVCFYAAQVYCKITKTEDPQEIVVDEVIGQFITCFLGLVLLMKFSVWFARTPYETATGTVIYENLAAMNGKEYALYLLISLIAFRFFDILKPWPISWADKNIKGGVGVMIDDVLAGIAAGIASALVFMLLKFYI
jgi:phosphatidylglycerophosphatase A